jgi:LTXXQ motif family protein
VITSFERSAAMKTLSLLAVLTTAAVLPLAAQQPGTPQPTATRPHMAQGHGMAEMGEMMPGMDSMMAPMMHVMAFTPEHLLREKTTLHITSDQQAELTSLRDAAKAAHDAAAQQAAMHMREMEQVMQAAAPDTSAAKTHFDAAHRFMGDAMWAMVRSAAQARALLTDAQRKQVDDMAARPMHGGGMMQH